MTNTNGDDPAMPIEFQEEYGDFGKTYPRVFYGLTKREQFAAMAMQGFIASGFSELYSPKVTEWSVKYANALITELNKPS